MNNCKYKIEAKKICEICNGNLYGNSNIIIEDYCNDTRKIKNGDLYVAIKGEKIDGNDYIEEALEKGAIGCIASKQIDESTIEKYKDKVFIIVENTIEAIQKIAKYKRNLYDIPVIAITGSVGKTSTKDIIASVLDEEFEVLKTEGNFNNHIGLPLTILKLKEHSAMVVEMGMNHFGEISTLTNIANPTIVTITNIGTAHIGILGSRENILKAKLEILEGLKENGKIIINNDNDLLNKWVEENKDIDKKRIITYGIKNNSNYLATNIEEKENESNFKIDNLNIKVNVPGEHFIYNALCAYAIGRALNIEENKIINGINKFSLTSKRMDIIKLNNNITVVNDSYNASLDSMKAALSVINKMQASRKIAVLGDMLELGDFSEELHRKVGKSVVENNIDILITVGENAKYISDEAKKLNFNNIFIFNNIRRSGWVVKIKYEGK